MVHPVVAQQADLSIFTPGQAPRVLDGPVLLIPRNVFTIADECNSMIDDRIPIATIKDSRPISIPSTRADRHDRWPYHRHCPHERLIIILWQPLPTSDTKRQALTGGAGRMEANGNHVVETSLAIVTMGEQGTSQPGLALLAGGVHAEVRRALGCVQALVHYPVHREFGSAPLAAARTATMMRVRHTRHKLLCRKRAIEAIDLSICVEHCSS